jgi:hypothetical protein
MANYNPPTENLPIFDNSVFVSDETPVTIGYANTHYLKFPTAQGTENLKAINVAGTATFTNNIVQSGQELTITQTDIDSNTTPNTFRQTQIYGDLTLFKPTTSQGGAMRLWDVGSVSGNSMQIYQSGLQTNVIGLAPGGFIQLETTNNPTPPTASSQRTVLRGSAVTGTSIQTFKIDSGANPQLRAVDLTSTKMIGFYANASASEYNPMTTTGSNIIFANTTTDSPNTETLLLTTRGTQSTGVRINPTSIMLGSGGTASDPSVRMNFDSTAIAATGPMTITSGVNNTAPLTITYSGTSPNYVNNGLTLSNCGITQSGAQSPNITNSLTNTTIAQSRALTIDKNAQLIFNVNAGAAAKTYNLNTGAGSLLQLQQTSSADSPGTTNIITVTDRTNINLNVNTTAGYNMPASTDSSTTVPSTAWVQSAIAAGGGNMTKNQVTITPTSNSVINTTGIYNSYNIGGRFSFNSSSTSTFLNVCSQPLNINIVNQSSNAYQDTSTGAIIYNPMVGPITIRVSCMAWNGNTSGQAVFDLIVNQQACFGVNNNASNMYNNWGRYQDSTTTTQNNLNYTLTNNWITQGSTVATGFNVTGLTSMATYGRQVWAYGQSISLPTLYAGMNKVTPSHAQIKLWFGGWASSGNYWYVSAEIINDSGAKAGSAGLQSGVYLS